MPHKADDRTMCVCVIKVTVCCSNIFHKAASKCTSVKAVHFYREKACRQRDGRICHSYSIPLQMWPFCMLKLLCYIPRLTLHFSTSPHLRLSNLMYYMYFIILLNIQHLCLNCFATLPSFRTYVHVKQFDTCTATMRPFPHFPLPSSSQEANDRARLRRLVIQSNKPHWRND